MNPPINNIIMDDALTEGSVRSFLKLFRQLFGRGIKQCENARFLMLEVPLAKDEVRKILPFGMRPSNPPRGVLFVVDYTAPTFTVPYKEAALMVRVRTVLGEGWHCCWMVMDDDTAMIYGREMLAFPKKRAEISFDEDGDRVQASVSRRGIEVVSIDAARETLETAPEPVFDVKTFNVGGMGQFLAFNPVWMFRITETVRESHTANATLRLQESRYDPLQQLIAGQPESGRFVVTDVTGARYLFPVGLAGMKWFSETFFMRFR